MLKLVFWFLNILELFRPFFTKWGLIKITLTQVEETSAITTRLTLSSMKNFMRLLLESNHGRIALALLDDLCTLVSAKYWLVKLELCSIIGDIPFLAVYHLTGKSHVQVLIIVITVQIRTGFEFHFYLNWLYFFRTLSSKSYCVLLEIRTREWGRRLPRPSRKWFTTSTSPSTTPMRLFNT